MPTDPPTWRDLGRRARRLGVKLQHGPHEAALVSRAIRPIEFCRFRSWLGGTDSHILRTAVAAALEQLERLP